MKFKGRLVSLTALILSVLLVFSGCSILAKNKDAEVEYVSEENVSGEFVVKSEVYYNQGDDLVTMYITEAEPFKDGYAYLCLEDTIGTKYNAITDKNGNITFFQEKSVRGDFRNSNVGYFYFEKIVGYKRESISCINYNGEEIYEIKFKETETLSSYQVEDWGDDGTVVISREFSGFDVSEKEFAWIDKDGKFLLNWIMFNNEIKSFIEFKYCENGFCYCLANDNKFYLLNLRNGNASVMEEGGRPIGEFMGGYLGVATSQYCYSISETGEVVATVDYRDWNRNFVENYKNSTSDSLVLNSSDWSLYDSSLTQKIVELNIPESSKGKPMSCTSFINGKAVLTIYDSNYEEYFTVINNKGEMLFDPVKMSKAIHWDGEYIMVADIQYGLNCYSKASFYDLSGNLVKEVNFENTEKSNCYFTENSFSEGLATIRCNNNYGYLKTDGTYLFEDGTVSVSME